MRVTNEVYFRRLREKLMALATWARVMSEHREQRRRRQKARQRWGKAIEKVRRQVRERANGAEEERGQQPTDEQPNEGRGARRGEPVAAGAYKDAREWTRRGERPEPKRRIVAKEGARVGIRMWWWLAEGSECGQGPLAVRRPRVGDG